MEDDKIILSNILLSIIIPVYNVEQYIEKCLESVACNLNRGDVEVIVVDDGSLDSSGEKADMYAAKYPYIKVIHKENAGVAVARNIGMDNALGEWLYFMDSDDWLACGAIDIICERVSANYEADILLFDAYRNTVNAEENWEHFENNDIFYDRQDLDGLQRGMLYFPMCDRHTNIPLAALWDKVYRRRFVIDNGLKFVSKLRVLDDMVFNMEAFGVAKRVAYYKNKIYHYRYVGASITNSYRPDRVSQDMEVWKYIYVYMGRNNKLSDEMFKQAYYCRIIKSFSICCRLCFFNPQNEKSLCAKTALVKKVMETEPYVGAFKKVRLKNAEWKLKVMILMGRFKFGFGVWLLHIAQNGLR